MDDEEVEGGKESVWGQLSGGGGGQGAGNAGEGSAACLDGKHTGEISG